MTRKAAPRFVTLGPSGTNHEFVTRKYVAFHRIRDAQLIFIDDFFQGLAMIHNGQADFMIQVAVHRDCAEVVSRARFDYGIHIMDTFISPSRELAILTRAEVLTPKNLAMQPATCGYVDITAWPNHVLVDSIMVVAEGLVKGIYDSGLTALDLVRQHPGRFRVDADIGTIDDAWLVFGRRRVSQGDMVAWAYSPGADYIRRYALDKEGGPDNS